MTNDLPRADEINVHDSLDEQWAVKHFFGKTPDEAQALFRENFLHYSGNLMYMGPRAFCFYVKPALSYLRSCNSNGDADAVCTFCSVLEYRLRYDRDQIGPAQGDIRDGISRILEEFDRFNCDPEIDGDVASRYRMLLASLAPESSQDGDARPAGNF